MTQFEEEKREKSAHFIVWTRKSTQKKPPYKPSGLYRGENKRKIYINRMSDYCILNALQHQVARPLCELIILHLLTFI